MRGLPHAIVLVLAGGLAAAAQAPDEPDPRRIPF